MSKPRTDFQLCRLSRRRKFLGFGVATAVSSLLPRFAQASGDKLEFELSLVESSLTRELAENKIDHLDFAAVAKMDFDITAVEYGSSFFPMKEPPGDEYIREMNKRAAEYGVRQLLIAVDRDIRIGDPVEEKRRQSVATVRRWIDVAKSLGCHSVQINPTSEGAASEQRKRVVDALVELCKYADLQKVHVLLGNYGGPSAVAMWVDDIIKAVDAPSCWTLPQIRNLTTDVDYQNLSLLVPYAKGMTACTNAFDDKGNETTTDYSRAMRIVHKAGYRGYVGICYQGTDLDERAGILATKALLEGFRDPRASRSP